MSCPFLNLLNDQGFHPLLFQAARDLLESILMSQAHVQHLHFLHLSVITRHRRDDFRARPRASQIDGATTNSGLSIPFVLPRRVTTSQEFSRDEKEVGDIAVTGMYRLSPFRDSIDGSSWLRISR
jgi:hypothetical protein